MTVKLEAARLSQDSTPRDPRIIQKAIQTLQEGKAKLDDVDWIRGWGDRNATCALGAMRWKSSNSDMDTAEYYRGVNTPNTPFGLAARALAANVPNAGCPAPGSTIEHKQTIAVDVVMSYNDQVAKDKQDILKLYDKGIRTLEMELENDESQ